VFTCIFCLPLETERVEFELSTLVESFGVAPFDDGEFGTLELAGVV
jgi:hypothetical protein